MPPREDGIASPTEPSDYSSCDESDNERYSSANSLLDSVSACSSFRSRGEFFESSRNLSFGDDLRSFSGKDLFGVDCNSGSFYASEEVKGESLRENGLQEDRLFGGRLEALPSIRTRPFRRDVFADADCTRKSGVLQGCSSQGGSLTRNVSLEAEDGPHAMAIDRWMVDEGESSDREISGDCSEEQTHDCRRSGENVMHSTYLGPFDTWTVNNADQEDVVDASMDVNGYVGSRLNRKCVVAEKVEASGSNGCLSNSASINRIEVSGSIYESSASPAFCASSSIQQSAKIDRVEVVGTRHRKGDVSFGERMIGVKEYGVYKLKVHSGNNQWEIERRYHDFFLLYCQLKVLFSDYGLPLPPPWSKVPHESRKIFGNASPPVIRERSVLIQDCLQSILCANTPFGTPSSLIWFLSPSNAFCDSNFSADLFPESFQRLKGDAIHDSSTLGMMLSQMVEIRTHKSKRELLGEQEYTCAGCHKYLDSKKSPIEGLIQMLGWGRFHICEFSGQLFCSSCHTNETAVLPARVLHHWDFTLYPVSNTAKAYLDSMYNQPILCISAVNPFLFLKVNSLIAVIELRKKIGALLLYIRCPFWRSFERFFGSRKYLLEANDYFALRDLVDLSKGAFSELPELLGSLLHKIRIHIMQQCPVCYELGIPCAAQIGCKVPSSLIYPLQETGAVRCACCGLIYHEACFGFIAVCQCGKTSSTRQVVGLPGPQDPGEEIELDGVVDSPTEKSHDQPSGYISELLFKARPDFQWKPRNSRLIVTMNSLLDAFS